VHSFLHKKSKDADGRDEEEGESSEDQIVASVEEMLQSLVERMAKSEPEDFELVCSTI